MVTFNSALPVELQLTDFSCSVGATFWCLRSVNVDLTQQALQDVMVPSLVSPDLGLLDGTGATIASLLRDRYGLAVTNLQQASFEDIANRAGKQPVLMGGHRWHVDPATGNATGHWVAVRGFDGAQLLLANPGGTGPNYGQQSLDRDAFANRGPFSAVVIEVAATGRTFRVAHTDGQGARLRSQPDANSPPITSLAEGTLLSGDEHAWRRVTTADGTVGWVAEELLSSGQ